MADGTLFGDLSRLNVIDLFCGAGGFSLGAQWALGYSPTAAVNHDPHSILIHTKNHPGTIHFQEDVFHVAPWEAARGRVIDLLIGSPDCTHFSVAKGAAPRDSGRRSLAEVFVKWAREIKPRVMIVENVREFQDWGPLYPEDHPDKKKRGRPIKERKGELFRPWVQAIRDEGYAVEWRLLRACDYGAPTSRLRFFLVARCDGKPIVWPEASHGGEGQPAHKTAAECIDWSIPTCSIFATRQEAKAWAKAHGIKGNGVPQRPLKESTMKRIAAGIKKYVLENPQPFLLCHTHGGRLEPIGEPMRTITTANRGERALIIPSLVQMGYGEHPGQQPRVLDLEKPLGTVVSGGNKFGLVSAFLAKHYTGVVGSDLADPLGTVTAVDHHSLVGVHLMRHFGASVGQVVDAPAPTITAGGGGKSALVAAFLQKYYGSDGQNQPMDRPLDTATVKARFGLVTVEIQGEPYAIVDIGMRMLEPRELARAQGFPDSFILEGTKADQIARIGNSVCPPVAEALVRANVGAP